MLHTRPNQSNALIMHQQINDSTDPRLKYLRPAISGMSEGVSFQCKRKSFSRQSDAYFDPKKIRRNKRKCCAPRSVTPTNKKSARHLFSEQVFDVCNTRTETSVRTHRPLLRVTRSSIDHFDYFPLSAARRQGHDIRRLEKLMKRLPQQSYCGRQKRS